jgi:tRNA modification GTPase
MVEIVLPGAPPLYGSILSSFLSHDLPDGTVRLALPGEFTLRAFRAGRIDLSQAEAVASLIRATSDFEERAAERQLRGELKERVEAISSEILGTLALAEAALDFPDEDLPEIAPRALSGRTGHLVEAMEELLSSSALRLADTGALRVALAGFPNAGKSSLLNALLGRPAAIVAGVAGTTRDPVRGTVAGAGREIEWIDLAGFEVLPPPEEEAGADEIARAVGRLTREELSTADVVVWVADAADGSRLEGSLALFRSLPACRKVLALNKSDLLMAADLDTLRSLPDRPAVLSAIRGQGLVDLIARVAESPGAAEAPQFLITARQEAALLRAREMIRKGSTLLGEGGGYELLSVDLRDALSALGEITGREVGEKVLDAIFGQFCIGK